MNFVQLVDSHGRTMSKDAPPILVAHSNYGKLGVCSHKGFIPEKGRWASTNAILRDADRNTIKMLRKVEDNAPKFVIAAIAAILSKEPMAMPYILGAISTYNGIIAARGGGNYQDVWMTLTGTAFTPATLQWYDLMRIGWTPGSIPALTNYVHAGTGGAVLDAASSGSWLVNPGGTNKKYLIACGLTASSITGYSLALLEDNLWNGSYSIVGSPNTQSFTPASVPALVRYTGTDSAGNRLKTVLGSTLTHTVPGTATFTYTDQAGTAGKTLISVPPPTGPLIDRVIFNTIHGYSTVVASTPYMPFTNAGSSGIRSLEQIDLSGGTISAGTVHSKIVRPLLMMPFIAAASFIEQDATMNIGNMIELVNASQVCGCLSWSVFSGGATPATMSAFLKMIEG